MQPSDGIGHGTALLFFDASHDECAWAARRHPCVDKKGNLYGAPVPAACGLFLPKGKHLGTIKVPETVSNVAWGDNDSKTLCITASTSVYRIILESFLGVKN